MIFVQSTRICFVVNIIPVNTEPGVLKSKIWFLIVADVRNVTFESYFKFQNLTPPSTTKNETSNPNLGSRVKW